MTEFREGDLVRIRPRLRPRSYVGEVGLVVEIEPLGVSVVRYLVGVVWPHVADTHWYRTTDLAKVSE